MEEDIKIIENSIKEVEDNKDIGFFETKEDLKFYNAVKHLLKAYKKKEADLYSANSIISEKIDIIKNSVSKDKIKEILNNRFTVLYEGNAEFPDDATKINKVKYINAKYLKELLEGDR